MRRAAIVLAAFALTAPADAGPALAIREVPRNCVGTILEATYEGPTTVYDHGVLGDAVEWTGLTVGVVNKGGDAAETCRWRTNQITVRLPDDLVFEDTAPRLADLDGDGLAEIITVETSLAKGARLSIWGMTPEGFRRRAATPFIGRPHRWLAPVAAGDLDGDGQAEVAYVDRPHLAKTLRVWRFAGSRLVEVAALPDVTNHQIGWDFIPGGLRDCGSGPQMVLASGDWREVVAVSLRDGVLTRASLGPLSSLDDIADAVACRR